VVQVRSSCLPLFVVAAAALYPPAAFAQIQPAQAGPLLVGTDFLIQIWRDGAPLPDQRAKLFFNRARCECEEPVQIVLRLSPAGEAKRQLIKSGDVRVYVGSRCLQEMKGAAVVTPECPVLGSAKLMNLVNRQVEINTTVRALFARPNQAADASACMGDDKQTLWLWVDANATNGEREDSEPDLYATDTYSFPLDLDAESPPAPMDVRATSGNEALTVGWTAPVINDGAGFVVFCARGGELPVFAKSGYDQDNHYSFCERTSPGPRPVFSGGGASSTGGTPVLAPDAFRKRDPKYLCSDLLTSQNSARITGLQNGAPYVVGVASVDKHGNASVIETAILQSPVPTRDFYRAYRAEGGDAEGGFCVYGRRGGRPVGALGPGLAIAAAMLWRARRRRRTA